MGEHSATSSYEISHDEVAVNNLSKDELEQQEVEPRIAAVQAARKAMEKQAGFAVVDNCGQVAKRFKLLADAQTFITTLSEPDRFGIRRVGKIEFDVRQTAQEIASEGETEPEIEAETESLKFVVEAVGHEEHDSSAQQII